MSALDTLARSLDEANAAALTDLDVRDTSILEAERAHLEKWVSSGTGIEEVAGDEVAAAVKAYRRDGTLDGVGQARLVCYGCTREIDGVRLIEELERFKALLEYVDRYRYFVRPFRRCYRALLHAYFTYDPEAELSEKGRRGWQ